MQHPPARLGIHIGASEDADPHEVDAATRQLRRELLDLDVDAVELLPHGEAPSGTRAVDPVALGGLVVTVANSQLFAAIVATVRTWLGAAQPRSISLEIDGDVLELTGVSTAEQSRLADEWLARHAITNDGDG
jgi:hypothetical protein